MKRILLSLGLWLGLTVSALAQCVSAGGINTVPQTGVACLSEPNVGTYAAAGYGIVPASSATDVACITGSATKTVRVQRVRISGTAGTLVNLPVLLTKHSVANTGGTAATSTALPVPSSLDSNTTTNPAATATTTAYTANPTIDATASIIDVGVVSLTATGTVSSTGILTFDFIHRNFAEAPTLRGIAQQLCLNLGAISVSSGLVAVSFLWTEAAQ